MRIIFPIVLLLNFALVHSSIFYLSNTGNGHHSGTKYSFFQTIQKAMKVIHPGDSEFVMGVIYEKMIRTRRMGEC